MWWPKFARWAFSPIKIHKTHMPTIGCDQSIWPGGTLRDGKRSKTATPTYGCSLSIWPGGHCGRWENNCHANVWLQSVLLSRCCCAFCIRVQHAKDPKRYIFLKNSFFNSFHRHHRHSSLRSLRFFFEKEKQKKNRKKTNKKNFNCVFQLLQVPLHVVTQFLSEKSLCSVSIFVGCVWRFCCFLCVFQCFWHLWCLKSKKPQWKQKTGEI